MKQEPSGSLELDDECFFDQVDLLFNFEPYRILKNETLNSINVKKMAYDF